MEKVYRLDARKGWNMNFPGKTGIFIKKENTTTQIEKAQVLFDTFMKPLLKKIVKTCTQEHSFTILLWRKQKVSFTPYELQHPVSRVALFIITREECPPLVYDCFGQVNMVVLLSCVS